MNRRYIYLSALIITQTNIVFESKKTLYLWNGDVVTIRNAHQADFNAGDIFLLLLSCNLSIYENMKLFLIFFYSRKWDECDSSLLIMCIWKIPLALPIQRWTICSYFCKYFVFKLILQHKKMKENCAFSALPVPFKTFYKVHSLFCVSHPVWQQSERNIVSFTCEFYLCMRQLSKKKNISNK